MRPENRLGTGPAGIEEIKAHEWFHGFDWLGIQQRTITAPLLPDPDYQPGLSAFKPFHPEGLGTARMRKDVFADEWENLWEWVGAREVVG